ncbi:BLOC-1-related complex subunit 6 [Trichogramma pretiosum]|uniref:BLOC-1-related complex subunit 6 n=1 Tax=Trichogramma pretiosum TaxID=7493 RepID=UPI0006C99900|nr:BLOC-1-related complex subunit 6 [Trichogramma pretiosum]
MSDKEKVPEKGVYEDEKLQEMTASYSEISFDSQSSSSSPDVDVNSLIHSSEMNKYSPNDTIKSGIVGNRPDCLNLSRKNEQTTDSKFANYQKSLDYLQSEGTVTKEGDMVSFVAGDLENKIKLSSPVTRKGDSMMSLEPRNAVSYLYRQALTPQLPCSDHNILNELENEARKVATSVDSITENLAAILHSASALTVGCLETYRDAVCKTCDSVDFNIKAMYQLMAKTEELSKSMAGIYKMSERIKEMRKMLDLFESTLNV